MDPSILWRRARELDHDQTRQVFWRSFWSGFWPFAWFVGGLIALAYFLEWVFEASRRPT